MDGIITLIIIGIVFSLIKKFSANAKNQQQQNQNNNTASAAKSPTLQSQLNRALRQINEIKEAATQEFSQPAQQNRTNNVTVQRKPEYQSSLEGHQMEGHKVEGFRMEGDKVEGHKVEGYKVEGLAQKHSDSKFSRDRIAVTESSMKSGFAGEGCDDHYDLGIAYSRKKKRPSKKYLHFSDNPIIQGVVVSQILERPKRR